MLRSKKCSQREMKRNKVASRETSKAVFEAADRLGVNAILIVGHSDTEKVYQQHHIPCKIETTLYARRKKYGSGDVTLLTNPGSICLR